jgi:chemotaxis protein MotB
MAGTARGSRRVFDIWPGFVDALASLLIVIIFVLLIFVVAQFYLTDALTGRDKALRALNQRIAELTQILSLERSKSAQLEKSMREMSSELRATLAERDKLRTRSRELQGSLGTSKEELEAARRLSTNAQAQIVILNRQILELRRQLAAIEEALSAKEKTVKEQELKLADLGKRLNIALAQQVQQLNRYRSEFFGRLREVLGQRKDIRIVGDRFVFQSEVLFPTGEAELQEGGKEELAKLAKTLKELAAKIPKDINWILRVDGHTDKRPIKNDKFPSNWELSQARALAVVKYLIEEGIPPERLAPTGFGEFHPLDPAETEEAYRKNRRIELKITER